MELFKKEPVLCDNGMFVYLPKEVGTESERPLTFTYNGVVLPPLPRP